TEINEILGERALEIAGTLDGQVRHFEDNIVTRLETIGSVISTQSDRFGETLHGQTEAIAGALDDAIGKLSNALDTHGTGLIDNLRSHATSVTHTITEVGQTAARSLTDATSQIQSETIVTLHKLADASQIVQTVIGSANEAIVKLEGTLADRIVGLSHAGSIIRDDAMESTKLLMEQIEAMRYVTGAGIGETKSLIDMLDERTRAVSSVTREHVDMLESATGMLTEVEQRLGIDLATRRENIEALTAGLNSRISDVQNVADNFASKMAEALQIVENRTTAINSLMNATSEQAGQALRDQFEAVRVEANEEKERTLEVVRGVTSTTVAEMGDVLSKLIGRFDETANDVKATTAQIAREIESTRDEIARSLVDLPRETQQQGATLRRAISDQAKALSELSNILIVSGRTTDVAKPVTTVAPVVSKPEPVYVPAPAPVFKQPVVPEVEEARAELKDRAPLASPTPVSRSIQATRPVAPAVSVRQEVSASVTPASEKGQRAGWLSDLLDRASRDDGKDADIGDEIVPLVTPKPQATMEMKKAELPKEPISALLSDIGQIVDENSVARLWNSYLKGEPAAFSRAIYTLEGQRRFEDLTALLASYERFRASIETYATKFATTVVVR
ncbi:MAG: hypothetical protein WCL29_07975, partial [Pseudomonadota bacterium]